MNAARAGHLFKQNPVELLKMRPDEFHLLMVMVGIIQKDLTTKK